MNLVKILHELGLTENQSRVYVSALQLGDSSVLQLAKASGLKRPSVYLILDELERLRLVTRKTRGKKIAYTAASPENIVDSLQNKLNLAQTILPSLKAIHNVNPETPIIRIAENVPDVQAIYVGIFAHLKNHPQEELIIYGALQDAVQYFRSSVVDYFYDIMRQSKNQIRELGNDDTETRHYFKKSHRLNPHHELRLVRSDFDGGFTMTDNMLYGNTLVIFSVTRQIFAVTIESASVTQTYRTLFDMAWCSGKVR